MKCNVIIHCKTVKSYILHGLSTNIQSRCRSSSFCCRYDTFGNDIVITTRLIRPFGDFIYCAPSAVAYLGIATKCYDCSCHQCTGILNFKDEISYPQFGL